MIIPIDDHYEIVAVESESGGSVGIRHIMEVFFDAENH